MNNTASGAAPLNGTASAEELELAKLIVTTLNMDVKAEQYQPFRAALYREGLGLDSIDILEISLAISKSYGVKLRSDDENNAKIFTSLRTLNSHIQQQRVR